MAKNTVFLKSKILKNSFIHYLKKQKTKANTTLYFGSPNSRQRLRLNDTLRIANIFIFLKHCKFKNVFHNPHKYNGQIRIFFSMVNEESRNRLQLRQSFERNNKQQLYSKIDLAEFSCIFDTIFNINFAQIIPLFLSFLQHGYCEKD